MPTRFQNISICVYHPGRHPVRLRLSVMKQPMGDCDAALLDSAEIRFFEGFLCSPPRLMGAFKPPVSPSAFPQIPEFSYLTPREMLQQDSRYKIDGEGVSRGVVFRVSEDPSRPDTDLHEPLTHLQHTLPGVLGASNHLQRESKKWPRAWK